VRGRSSAHEARLGVDEFQMLGVPNAPGRAERECGFIDWLRGNNLRIGLTATGEALPGPLGIAFEEVSIMPSLAGRELRPRQTQPLDRWLIVGEEAGECVRQRRSVDRSLQPRAKVSAASRWPMISQRLPNSIQGSDWPVGGVLSRARAPPHASPRRSMS
jgi:hypothetical protein